MNNEQISNPLEPENYLPPDPKPTFHIFNRFENCIGKVSEENDDDKEKPVTIKSLTIRTVGSHPLWGHYLWNASKILSNYLDNNSKSLVENKFILEFGAGGALTSLICAVNMAKKVVITDYPDDELIENIKYNIITNIGVKKIQDDRETAELPDNIIISGYIWGRDTKPLLSYINPTNYTSNNERKYDLILLSDLLANHSEHKSLLKSCKECLEPINGQVLVFFTHHRPHLIKQDLTFFRIATEEENFKVEKILQERISPMFVNDPGDEEVRSTVYGYRLSLY